MSWSRVGWMALAVLLLGACEGQVLISDDSRSEVGAEATAGEASEGQDVVIEGREVSLAPGRMHRLTNAQYRTSVRAVFGDAISFGVELEPDESAELFLSIGASKVGTSPRGVELYQESALDVASQVFQNRDAHALLSDCGPDAADDPCIEEVVRHYGRLLWRRPPTDGEVDRLTAIVSAAGTEPGQLELGLQYAVASLMASPNFLYVSNVGEPDPETGARRYTNREMASRLAYFVWNAPPDDALISAAENGELQTSQGIRTQVERMLHKRRARTLPSRFFGQSWNVAQLHAGLQSSDTFPEWDEELVDAYRTEFDLVLRDIVFERDADVFEIFTAERTFVNRRLGDVYQMTVESDGWVETELGESRTGLLTSGAVVASNSNSKNFLPTHRGVFVMERILCQHPPAPTDDVMDDIEEARMSAEQSDEPMTTRETVEQHASDPECAGCHASFDPMGFTYENFDRIGRYQTEQNGRPVDATGDVFGERLEGVPELADWLAADPRTSRCISERLYSFATGRHPIHGEAPLVDDVDAAFVDGGRRFDDLVVAVATSPGFRYLAAPTEDEKSNERESRDGE